MNEIKRDSYVELERDNEFLKALMKIPIERLPLVMAYALALEVAATIEKDTKTA
ncbi:MAG: hypothetical protein LBU47_01865 [Christensenellaceae bacterium]|jgi:hypothetical protein|nr:hypothetical protein [Christensenellaceae bacterium]